MTLTMPMKSENGMTLSSTLGIMQETVSLMASAVAWETSPSVCRRYSASMPGRTLMTLRMGSLVKPTGAMWTCIRSPRSPVSVLPSPRPSGHT